MIVVDASVAVKWFVPEPGEDAAQQLLAGGELLFAPALIRIEVAGAILRYFREGKIKEDKTRSVLADWENLLAEGIVRQIDDEQLYPDAIAVSLDCRHALNDCFYLAAAKMLDASVVTADVPMHKRGKLAYDRISLLEGSNAN